MKISEKKIIYFDNMKSIIIYLDTYKVKLSLCLTKYYAMNVYGGVGV
jgi:hypothetical protein